MSQPGSESQPLRVAVIGSGPAGFYTVQALFKSDRDVRVDMFDSLPTPFGLVRFGVAPDHQKIKSVVAVYHKLASDPRFRFFGNVSFGQDIDLEFLRQRYHQVVFATGAQTDRRLGIPGEDLRGSHPATEFVAWYNGHPDFSHLSFDLDCERVAVVGVGNVAVDVARILCRTREELEATDIADYALEALSASKIKEVYLLGRRGPAQAAFSNPEVKELGELDDASCRTLADEMRLDAHSQEQVEGDKATRRKLDILNEYIDRDEPDKSKRLTIRFLVSPVELQGDADGRVQSVRIVKNELVARDNGSIGCRALETFETLDAGLVFRSVGYRGVALPEVPFREDWGIIPNADGRILDRVDGDALPGLYVSGWIKRGPSGVIGTNKPDAFETVRLMLEDLDAGKSFPASSADSSDTAAALDEQNVRYVTYDQWLQVDALEVARGKELGRPRLKVTRTEAVLEALEALDAE